MKTQTLPSIPLAVAATKFKMNPCGETEALLIATLNDTLRAEEFLPLNDAFIDYGCLEHELITVLSDDGQHFVEVNPDTGVATSI